MVPGWDDFAKLFEKFFTFFPRVNNKQWKKEQVCQFFVVVQLIHRLTKADISCTTTACLLFFPLLGWGTTIGDVVNSRWKVRE